MIDKRPETNAGLFTLRSTSMLAALFVAGVGLGLLFTEVVRVSSTVRAAKADTAAFSKEQKSAIEGIVREYLLANPELFLEIQEELDKRVAKKQEEQFKKALAENSEFLFRRTSAPIAGNPDGDIPVVEFFDYNCGYCKRGLDDVAGLIKKDPKVKVVFMEYPILSKGSLETSRAALAAKMQGKYWEMHQALLQHRGRLDKATSLKIAGKIGLDRAKLEKDMESAEVTKEIEGVRNVAKAMGIGGTPHFLVGDRAIPGAPDDLLGQLAQHVTDLRRDGCAVC